MQSRSINVRRAKPRTFDHLWWLNPIFPFSFMLVSMGLAAYLIPEIAYIDNWRTPKYIGGADLKFVFLSVLAFALSAVFVNVVAGRYTRSFTRNIENNTRLPWPIFWFIFYLSFGLVLMAYAIWLIVSVLNGLSVADIIAAIHNDPSATYVIHDKTETVPGITTLTQLAMGMFLLGIILGFRFGWGKNLSRLILPMGIILILTLLRSHFRDERLALIEIVVPVAILLIAFLKTEKWPIRFRCSLAILPLVAPIALYIFFSAAEYSRSWSNFYKGRTESSFFEFTFIRLAGYYVTALNNGATFVQTIGQYDVPFHSLEFFWKFPIIKSVFKYQSFSNAEPWDDYQDLLKQKLNPEFNNPSGIYVIELDYGFIGGIVFWSMIGMVAMLLYRSFRQGHLTGLLVYPIFYIGLIESPRILYWSLPRAFPTWLLILTILLISLQAAHGDWRKPLHQSRNFDATSSPLPSGLRRRQPLKRVF